MREIDGADTRVPAARVRAVTSSEAPLSELLSDLVVVAHRSVRLGALATADRESPAVWRTLSVLVSTGPLRLGELARWSRVSQPTMTKIVQKLTAAGWIDRILDPVDARAAQLQLTPAGASALSDWRRRLGEALAPAFSDLTDADRDVLAQSVTVLRGVLFTSGALPPGIDLREGPPGQG